MGVVLHEMKKLFVIRVGQNFGVEMPVIVID